MAIHLEPLNMHGHANTWEEELLEVARERDELRAENERLNLLLREADKGCAALLEQREAEVERLRLLGTAESINKGIAETRVERLQAYADAHPCDHTPACQEKL